MDHLQQLRRRIRVHLLAVVISENLLLILISLLLSQFSALQPAAIAAISLAAAVTLSLAAAFLSSSFLIQPVQAIWQAVLHLSPTDHGIAAPNIDSLKLGRELVQALNTQIYALVDQSQQIAQESRQQMTDISQNFVAQNLPLPLILLDATETITFANTAAAQYIGLKAQEMIGKNVYMVLDMSFPNQDTFDGWLKQAKSQKATASNSWERVRLNVRDNHPSRLFDLAAYYNRDNTQRIETMLALFDHTKMYSQDEQAVSFIALSVHELRTPLTLLRGYIEVFEDEFGDKVDAELQGFMLKMRSQADQLMAFVNNILNVARVDDDQLELQLAEEQWPDVLKAAIEALSLRAKVRGITLRCRIVKDLPAVGIDRLSIYEVINNLVDNAIKYSGNSTIINIDAYLTKDGLVETTIQDFGLGISTSVIPNLFTKFYRDHRNRAQVGGTGLGLYLSKAIVTAHGGSIWVRSKENEGTTFGFTLIPYTQLTEEMKQSGNQEIVRGAHGWIKNHSLYRR